MCPRSVSRPLRAVSIRREGRTAAPLPAARRAPDGPARRYERLGTARSAGVARPGTRPGRASPPRGTGDLPRRRRWFLGGRGPVKVIRPRRPRDDRLLRYATRREAERRDASALPMLLAGARLGRLPPSRDAPHPTADGGGVDLVQGNLFRIPGSACARRRCPRMSTEGSGSRSGRSARCHGPPPTRCRRATSRLTSAPPC